MICLTHVFLFEIDRCVPDVDRMGLLLRQFGKEQNTFVTLFGALKITRSVANMRPEYPSLTILFNIKLLFK